MKGWLVSYSVKYEDGTEKERKMMIEAVSLGDAYKAASQKIWGSDEDDNWIDAVIWDVGIIDDYVW